MFGLESWDMGLLGFEGVVMLGNIELGLLSLRVLGCAGAELQLLGWSIKVLGCWGVGWLGCGCWGGHVSGCCCPTTAAGRGGSLDQSL